MALDAVLVAHARLAACAATCRHCGIRFLTHPRNANRQDLHCPFGCRDELRRRRSKERSRKYSRSAAAQRKKKRLNAKRSLPSVACAEGLQAQPVHSPAIVNPGRDVTVRNEVSSCAAGTQLGTQAERELGIEPGTALGSEPTAALGLEGVVLTAALMASSKLLPYVGLVVSLIVGRRISHEEVLEWLQRALRQRSIGRERRIDYVVRVLNQRPP